MRRQGATRTWWVLRDCRPFHQNGTASLSLASQKVGLSAKPRAQRQPFPLEPLWPRSRHLLLTSAWSFGLSYSSRISQSLKGVGDRSRAGIATEDGSRHRASSPRNGDGSANNVNTLQQARDSNVRSQANERQGRGPQHEKLGINSFQPEFAAMDNRNSAIPAHWMQKLESGGKSKLLARDKAYVKLSAEDWDGILLQRDPTEALREIAWLSILDDDKGQPVYPDLWWVRDTVNIQYGEYNEREMRKEARGAGKILINHVIQVVKQAPCRPRVRWAALLHDVGKPATVTVDHERKKLIFHAHESVGALMVERILSSYGYGEKFRREVASLVLRSGRIRMVDKFMDQGARRILSVCGPLFMDLLHLYWADCTSVNVRKQKQHYNRGCLLRTMVHDVLDRDRIKIKRPPLNGHQVMAITGLPEGRPLGRLMNDLRKDFLSRGPYSAEEAALVAKRLYEEYVNMPAPIKQRKKVRDKEKEEQEMINSQNDPTQVLVFRIKLDHHEGADADHPEVFRDLIVHHDTSLFDFALEIVHSFDFDFDDTFSFYRRRMGSFCPGAEAAYGGICDALLLNQAGQQNKGQLNDLQQQQHVQDVKQATLGVDDREEYELIASTKGIPKALDHEESCYSYDVRYSERLGDWVTSQGEVLVPVNDASQVTKIQVQTKRAGEIESNVSQETPTLKIESTKEEDMDDDADDAAEQEEQDDGFWKHNADTMAYPLMLPQKGEASLSSTYIGNLFGRSRRSMLLVFDNGGPWRFTITFVQARTKKEYESPPCVIARMGSAPRQYKHPEPTADSLVVRRQTI